MFLALAVLAFVALHLIPAFPGLKSGLKARFGAAWGPGFGVASLLLLGLVIYGWATRDFIPVYEPPVWGRHVTFSFVLIAFLMLGIWLFRGSYRQAIRFPFAIAAMFWGAGHLFVRGDQASLTLFGGLALYGLAHLLIGLANGIRPEPVVRKGHNLLSLIMGLALYGAMTQLHPILIGVPVLTLTH